MLRLSTHFHPKSYCATMQTFVDQLVITCQEIISIVQMNCCGFGRLLPCKLLSKTLALRINHVCAARHSKAVDPAFASEFWRCWRRAERCRTSAGSTMYALVRRTIDEPERFERKGWSSKHHGQGMQSLPSTIGVFR